MIVIIQFSTKKKFLIYYTIHIGVITPIYLIPTYTYYLYVIHNNYIYFIQYPYPYVPSTYYMYCLPSEWIIRLL